MFSVKYTIPLIEYKIPSHSLHLFTYLQCSFLYFANFHIFSNLYLFALGTYGLKGWCTWHKTCLQMMIWAPWVEWWLSDSHFAPKKCWIHTKCVTFACFLHKWVSDKEGRSRLELLRKPWLAIVCCQKSAAAIALDPTACVVVHYMLY